MPVDEAFDLRVDVTSFMTMLAAMLIAVQAPVFDFNVTSGTGLTVSVHGTPLVRGSWFQYYEPGWTKGYYSSLMAEQQVQKVDADTYRLVYRDGQASGTAVYHRVGDRLVTDYEFDWSGDKPVLIETGTLVWAPAFQNGSLTAAGKPKGSLNTYLYDQTGLQQRRFSTDASTYSLDAPIAKVDVDASTALTFFDARGYNQDWAVGTEVWWLGHLALETSKDQPAKLHIEWKISPKGFVPPTPKTIAATTSPVSDARVPDESLSLLIPAPKTNQLDFTKPVGISGRYSFPIGHAMHFGDFQAALARRFVVPAPDPKGHVLAVDAGISKLGFKPGGYRITITKDSISVLGEEEIGLRNGWRRLAQISFARNGRLWLPVGTLLDQPSIGWRGVHLFVGPEARAFQRNLWERVLLPMGYNEVVLQCERTGWQSTPGIATGMTMPRQDLKALFDTYRSWGVDPIPLIQSWGHMEWLFANGKNAGLRFNPDSDYSIDPRKEEARKQVASIWNEAIALLEPKTIHFGLDEVDMRGWPDDKEMVTRIWESYLPFLGGIAKSHQVDPMLWGDELLSPKEAIDAGNAGSPELAQRRRDAVPKGSFIGNWHYSSEPSPNRYYPSLQLLKQNGFQPVASTWYAPQNIQGFGIAAQIEKVGFLQTTWAGYVSNERNMIDNIAQFAAMVTAAEYAWGGSYDPPSKFGYDPIEQFRKMYFGSPSPLKPAPGLSVRVGQPSKSVTIEGIRFVTFAPLALGSTVIGGDGASSLTIPIAGKGRSLWLAVDTAVRANDGESVAELVATMKDGKQAVRKIRYGQDVRSADDSGATTVAPRSGGLSAVRLGLPSEIVSLAIRAENPYAGLRVHGIVLTD